MGCLWIKSRIFVTMVWSCEKWQAISQPMGVLGLIHAHPVLGNRLGGNCNPRPFQQEGFAIVPRPWFWRPWLVFMAFWNWYLFFPLLLGAQLCDLLTYKLTVLLVALHIQANKTQRVILQKNVNSLWSSNSSDSLTQELN